MDYLTTRWLYLTGICRAEGRISTKNIERQAKELLSDAGNAPAIKVVWRPSELPFKAPVDARGVYRQGVLWMIDEGIRSAEDVREVAFHELTHFGLRGFFGAELDGVLARIHDANLRVRIMARKWRERTGNRIAVLESEYRLSDEGIKLISVDEALSALANCPETWQSILQNVGPHFL